MATVALISVIFTLVNSNAYQLENKPFRDIKYGANGGGYIEGFVTHGINNFNGQRIVDLSLKGNGFGQTWDAPIYQQQVLNKNGPTAILPVDTTDRNLELSMGRFFTDKFQFIAPITPNEHLFNQPYYNVGTITQRSLNIDHRSIPKSFDQTGSHPSAVFDTTYLPKSVNPNPTLGEWEKGSGLIEIDCNDGIGAVTVSVCNLLPNSLYTVWEVGSSNPGVNETGYWVAAGGIGNVIRTDKNGNGELNIIMPWCPLRECIPNTSKDCQIYFSVFHQSDGIVWGGALGIFWKPYSYPAGISGADHLFFPLFGEALQQPLNRYNENHCKCATKGAKIYSALLNDKVKNIEMGVSVNNEDHYHLTMDLSSLILINLWIICGIIFINVFMCCCCYKKSKKRVEAVHDENPI